MMKADFQTRADISNLLSEICCRDRFWCSGTRCRDALIGNPSSQKYRWSHGHRIFRLQSSRLVKDQKQRLHWFGTLIRQSLIKYHSHGGGFQRRYNFDIRLPMRWWRVDLGFFRLAIPSTGRCLANTRWFRIDDVAIRRSVAVVLRR